jgi:protein-L-isoaspartate(D-aspartate) O-methyltransferase
MQDYAQARHNMVENQLRPNRVEDPRVLRAMGELPRELFVPKSLQGVAYSDEDIDLGNGRHLIEPLALGKLLQAAEVRPDDVALVLGCDTGYCTAVVSRLAATVFLLVAEDESTATLDSRLSTLGCDNAVVQAGVLREGLPSQAPFDLILLAGSVAKVPDTLLAQLAENGRLVAVVHSRHAGKVALFRNVGGAIGHITPFDASIPELVALRPAPRFVF